MSHIEQHEAERVAWVEEKIKWQEANIYGGDMPAHNKAVVRKQLLQEDRFWEKEAVREDSHSAVGDWNGARLAN